MEKAVTARIVRIGNSRGVRIPKALLEQLDLGDEVALAVQGDQLVIRAARHPREGWEEQFRAMHAQGDDRPGDEFPTSAWDEREWAW